MSVSPPVRPRALLLLAAVLAVLAAGLAGGQSTPSRLPYPAAARDSVVDDYHGTKVADPYRWLEDGDSPQAREWVDAENVLTRSYLDAVPGRAQVRRRLTELYDYPRVSVPQKRGSRYFFSRNEGLQNQPVYYVQEALDGKPRLLLDPNALSPDGTVALTNATPSEHGSRLAYALSASGSDRQEICVRDVDSGKDLPDRLRWVKFTTIAWTPDEAGFYYTRFPRPGQVPAGDENYFAKVYFHRLGDPQERDSLIFEKPDRKEVVPACDVTHDGRFAVFTAFLGSSSKTEVWVLDRTRPGARPEPLFTGFKSRYSFIEGVDGRLYFLTDEGAARGRVVALEVGHGQRPPEEVLAESPDLLNDVAIVNRRLVAFRLHNASALATVYSLAGQREADLTLPGLGSVASFSGRPEDTDLFLSFASFVQPATIYRYDFATHRLVEFQRPALKFWPQDYETQQVWYPSKDGTKVSMFLVCRRGTKPNGALPTLLSGYGGFDVNEEPSFEPGILVWLERGGLYAVPNLRGGGEYGEHWHEAGMLDRKQNVFDDFIAAAQWLIENRYTCSSRLAIEGASNGGLLVSACLTQRPALFGAVICRVPLADMLRYQRFTVARFWIPEYGCADDPGQFSYLIRYSPYHNVRDGVSYPATLITTADHDDRVAPLHAEKLAARLQAASAGAAPILIRIETKAGHGTGKPTSKRIEEALDVWSFLFRQFGLAPPGGRGG